MPGDYAKLPSPDDRTPSPTFSDTRPSSPRDFVDTSGNGKNTDVRHSSSTHSSIASSKDELDDLDTLDDPLDITDAISDSGDGDSVPFLGGTGRLLADREAGMIREARSRRYPQADGERGSVEDSGYRLPTDGGGILNSFFNM